jgi:membrane-associated phospholipid phosphatase
MFTTSSLTKPILILSAGLLMNGIFQHSLAQTANYEAAKWNTWCVAAPQLITIAAPPNATQTKAEIQLIKQRIKNLDEKKIAEIKYWNAASPSYRWNQIAPKLFTFDRIDLWARTPSAWMNMAIYDATVIAWREKIKYKRMRPGTTDPGLKPVINAPLTYSYPCEHTVTAAAAATVMAYFIPEKADSIIQLARNASQSRIDAGVQYPSDVEAAWKLGEQVAKEVIEKAKKDGADRKFTGQVNKDPKKWTGGFALGVDIPLMTPMVLTSPEQFRPAAPPDFEKEMKELKSFKRTFNSNSQAYYWANTDFDYWSELATKKMHEYRWADDAPAAARLYTILYTAQHDAAISVMDAKYAYWGIRPNQYDTTYKSLIQTPPFPGFPSGHAMVSSTCATILEHFFPADAKMFRKLAQDCADSRFYAGIHFRSDNEIALTMGRQLATFVVDALIRK